jgi:hypothetical protein
MRDLTTKPCYVLKNGNVFAHGETINKARMALEAKLFDGMPVDERIKTFAEAHESGKRYSCAGFFDWHNKLTGSCLMGRKAFVENNGIDMDGNMSVEEFIALTENSYGGNVIKSLKDYYEKAKP